MNERETEFFTRLNDRFESADLLDLLELSVQQIWDAWADELMSDPDLWEELGFEERSS